ncbi:MAG: DUF1149 family protein [Lactovum sp.]
MDLMRSKEVVNFFHYDARNLEYEKEHGTPETRINVQLHILTDAKEDLPDTKVQINLSSLIVLNKFVLSSAFSQVTQVIDRQIKNQADLTQQEMQELASPLFEILKDLAYEITEVALDEPGLRLEF